MNNQLIERVRVAYAGGCYTMYELWDSYRHVLNPNQVKDILDYRIAPEVREDLRVTITDLVELSYLFKAHQEELHKEVEKCESYERTGKTYPYEDRVTQLNAVYKGRIEDLDEQAKRNFKKKLSN
jgi:hypothetical protein